MPEAVFRLGLLQARFAEILAHPEKWASALGSDATPVVENLLTFLEDLVGPGNLHVVAENAGNYLFTNLTIP